ncbi:MAG: hypothetical protein IJJ22_04440 [Oscillospiraceae bacterium]|nr:hypothetical protein [Oscillospiraceae bacterium]
MGRRERTPAQNEERSYNRRFFAMLRNIFAVLTAVCFIASFFLHNNQLLVRGIGYCLGVFAYFSELLELTEGFNRKKHMDDLFMAVCFGGLYIFMAISYIMEHYGQ